MLIGIIGLIGSGKGTVGDMLIEQGFEHESFASSLKDAASSIFNWDRTLLEGITPASRVVGCFSTANYILFIFYYWLTTQNNVIIIL